MDPAYRSVYRELYQKHWWWRAREEIICDELRARLAGRGPVTILDVGCGDGLMFDRLKEFGKVEGVEPEAELISPNGAHRAHIVVAPFDSSFQPGRKYSVILMLDVLEHLDAPGDALRHAVSLLEPSGIVVATVPAFRLIWSRHDELNQHRTRFTKKSLTQLAWSAGLQIICMRYFFTWLFPVKLAAGVLEKISRKNASIPGIPAPFLNRSLYAFSRAEERFTRKTNVPFGSSLLAVGQSRTTMPNNEFPHR